MTAALLFFAGLAAGAESYREYPVGDYRHFQIFPQSEPPDRLTPVYQNQRARFSSLEVLVPVGDQVSDAFLRATFEVTRLNGERTAFETGFRKITIWDGDNYNFYLHKRAADDMKLLSFAQQPENLLETGFTEPSLVMSHGFAATGAVFHEISIAMSQAEFMDPPAVLGVEIRLRHLQDEADPARNIRARRLIRGVAKVRPLNFDEARVINQLSYLNHCEGGLAH